MLLLEDVLKDHNRTLKALDAGITKQWLTRLPFLSLPEGETLSWSGFSVQNPLMSSILSSLQRDPDGREELSKYGFFLGDESEEESARHHGSELAVEHFEIGDDESPVDMRSSEPLLPRTRPTNLEERARRRRWREAIVVAEPGRPVERSDIILQPLSRSRSQAF